MGRYEDSKYRNKSKWEIKGETWVVTGVWFFSDDEEGMKNASTDKIAIRKVVNGVYVGNDIYYTLQQLNSLNPKKL